MDHRSLPHLETRQRSMTVFSFFIALAMLLTSGCTGSESEAVQTPSGTSGSTNARSLSGDIKMDGSSTVFPISEAVAEEFRSVSPRVRVQVGISGTGGGFKRFCAGETDISNASRPIKEKEREICINNGIEFIELLVGWDGLSIVVNPHNNFASNLSIEELNRIYEAGSKIDNWNQVRSSFPQQDLDIFAPDVDSGTFDFLSEVVLGKQGAHRDDYTASSDDNVLVQGIAGEKGATGYFGYAYYIENQDKVKVVHVDGVAPNRQTILSGAYPLTRPLFIYVKTDSLRNKPQVLEFVRFYIDNAPDLVADVDYVPVSAQQYDDGRDAVEQLIGSAR